MWMPLVRNHKNAQLIIDQSALYDVGRNCVTGLIFDESENSISLGDGLTAFGLDREGATLMTDGGSAFPSVATEKNMVHTLCTQHFQKDIFASTGGLGSSAQNFQHDAMELIYHPFCTTSEFEAAYHKAVSVYRSAGAASCLTKIYHDKQKVCAAYTGYYSCLLLLLFGIEIVYFQVLFSHATMSPHSDRNPSTPLSRSRERRSPSCESSI